MTKRACKTADLNRWGVPDWRDANAYPMADSLSMIQWWWEFTRRRPDYRDLWNRWSPQNYARIDANAPFYRKMALSSFENDSLEVALDRAATDDPDGLRLKFQMSTLLNPKKMFSAWDLSFHHYHANAIHGYHASDAMKYALRYREIRGDTLVAGCIAEISHIEKKREEMGIVQYIFDLSKPLEPQFRKARFHLETIQKETFRKKVVRKPRRQNWPLFLRAMDAREGCETPATFQEMSTEFWPHQDKEPQSARDTYEAACDLRVDFPL